MKEWIARVSAFMDKHIYPNVETFEKQHAAGDRWVTPQIVNDLKAACEALRRVVDSLPDHVVAWTAADGVEAIAMAKRDRPDLILMDLLMPHMDGAQATRQIMASAPCAILVVTATVSGNIDFANGGVPRVMMVHHTAQGVRKGQQTCSRGEMTHPAMLLSPGGLRHELGGGPLKAAGTFRITGLHMLDAEKLAVDAEEALQAGGQLTLIRGKAADGGGMNAGGDGDFHVREWVKVFQLQTGSAARWRCIWPRCMRSGSQWKLTSPGCVKCWPSRS
jgi:CheY-like chemotaxis protein